MIEISFIALTLCSVIVTVFTFGYYLAVFTAVRQCNLSISKFHYYIQDAQDTAYVDVTTIVTLSNPSTFEFQLVRAEEVVWVNWSRLGSTSAQGIPVSRPTPIPPQTSRNLTMSFRISFEHLSEETIEILMTPEKTWNLALYLSLRGPLVGTFYLRTMERMSTT